MLYLLTLIALFLNDFTLADRGVESIVAQWNDIPKSVPTSGSPDGPLLGNGIIGAVLGVTQTQQTTFINFHIGSNEFWDISDSSNIIPQPSEDPPTPTVRTVGSISIGVDSPYELKSFNSRSFPVNGTIETNLIFSNNDNNNLLSIHLFSFIVPSSFDNKVSYLITELDYSSIASVNLTIQSEVPVHVNLIDLSGFESNQNFVHKIFSTRTAGLAPSHNPDDRLTVAFGSSLFIPSNDENKGYKLISTNSDSISQVTSIISLNPSVNDNILYLISAITTDSYNPTMTNPSASPSPALQAVYEALDGVITTSIDTFYESSLSYNLNWWNNYWAKTSSIQSDDDPATLTLNYYYGALYLAGMSIPSINSKSISKSDLSKVAPPGLYGPFVTNDTPNWHGDLTLNYNFESVWYGLYSANLPDYGYAYLAAFEPYLDNAASNAKYFNCPGLHFPVHLAPFGYSGSLGPQGNWKQQSIGLFISLNLINHYELTLDVALAKRIYPIIKGVVDFHLCFLVNETTTTGYQYVPDNDCANEDCNGGSQSSRNSILTNSFLRKVLPSLIKLNQLIDLDQNLINKWNETLIHLIPLPYDKVSLNNVETTIFGFADNEKNVAIGQNPLNVYPLFPSALTSLVYPSTSEDQVTLANIARDTVLYMQSWKQGNAFSQIFPAAVRSIIDPYVVFNEWNSVIKSNLATNLWLQQAGGGIETIGSIGAVNDMLVQSDNLGRLSLFGSWPRNVTCRFYNVRAPGAFIINGTILGSSSYIAGFYIHSEAGSKLSVMNPWPTNHVVVSHLVNDTRTPVPIVYHGLNQKEWIEVNTEAGQDYFLGASF